MQAVFVTHKKTGSLKETARFSNMVGGTGIEPVTLAL
jgi:hypothetical protein